MATFERGNFALDNWSSGTAELTQFKVKEFNPPMKIERKPMLVSEIVKN